MGTCSTKNQGSGSGGSLSFPYITNFSARYMPSGIHLLKAEHVRVFRAVEIPSGLPVIIKAVSKASEAEDPAHEVEVLKKLQPHPNLQKLREYFQTIEFYYIVYEDDDGQSVLDYLERSSAPLTLQSLRRMLKQILEAVEHLHAKHVAHCKLDFSNIWCNEKGDVCIKGFESSVDFSVFSKNSTALILSRSRLSLGFQAPELLSDKCGLKSDVWTLGVVFYCMVAASMPFSGKSKNELRAAILEKQASEQMLTGHGASPDLVDLIQRMLTKPYDKRPTVKELLDAPFLGPAKKTAEGEAYEMAFAKLQAFAQRNKVVQAIKYHIASSAMLKSERDVFMRNFTMMDLDKDGAITLADLAKLRQQLGLPISEAELQGIFESVDRKKTGKIKYNDFLAAFVQLRDSASSEQLRLVFNAMDKQKKGLISVREIEDFLGDDPDIVGEMEKLEPQLKSEKQVSFNDFKNLLIKYDQDKS